MKGEVALQGDGGGPKCITFELNGRRWMQNGLAKEGSGCKIVPLRVQLQPFAD